MQHHRRPAPRHARSAGLVGHDGECRTADITALPFEALEGFRDDDHAEAFRVFRRSAASIVERRPCLRKAMPASAALETICRLALRHEELDSRQARSFFETHFQPFRMGAAAKGGTSAGFVTGYYEPIVTGSLTRSPDFTAPILAPCGQSAFSPVAPAGVTHSPCPPDRATIEALAERGLCRPVVWLRDKAEVFFVQVQGSARVRLDTGEWVRLVYAGRNGWPYTSIGKILIETGEIAPADMSLQRLERWIRSHGQGAGEPGAALMRQNRSYVFFRLEPDLNPDSGPIGGQGLSLTALRSIAIDRTFSTYGQPIWISADLPRQRAGTAPFRRLMIAQDTGTAIVGPARADIFFGCGRAAAARAGRIRHAADIVHLVPKQESLGT